MLELNRTSFAIVKDGEEVNLIDQASIRVPRGHFMAIVGPSGCGKTTLLKTIAGLNAESAGRLSWEGKDLATEKDFEPWEIGYVPQFSIAYDELTVDENVESVTRLRVACRDHRDMDDRIDRVLAEAGLDAIADRRVSVLSGGQKRRLGLAMELVSDPSLLLCDEVTSGLDPRSEREIVHLLHDLSRRDGRIVISVTHSLAHLELYDSILVLHEGRVVYHGPPMQLSHYFGVEDMEEVYPQLAKQPSERWAKSWSKHRTAYYGKLQRMREKFITDGSLQVPKSAREVDMQAPLEDWQEPGERDGGTSGSQSDELDEAGEGKSASSRQLGDSSVLGNASDLDSSTVLAGEAGAGSTLRSENKPAGSDAEGGGKSTDEIIAEEAESPRQPGFFAQFTTLVGRRWRIFFRDRGQVVLQVAMILIFPFVVTLFADRAEGAVKRFTAEQSSDLQRQVVEREQVLANQMKKGGGVSGVIMFQIILLALMGSNNAAREIAGERKIMEKEKFGGMRISAYLASKVVFLGSLILVQSLFMACFVQFFWAFEGNFMMHVVFVVLINAAMTAICLGISAVMKTPDQASLLSIYLVGFQLPLSGAILALPEQIDALVRPFISAYWAWSGSLDGLNAGVNNAVRNTIDTTLTDSQVCIFVLLVHLVVGGMITLVGISRPQWEH